LKPVFRRELRQRDDLFNKRFLSFQAGYQYISSLGSGVPYLEHRWVVDCTPRYPLAWNVIISDRSRGEMRFIRGQPFSTRYRNKLQAERDFAIGHLAYTPYLEGEVFYDALWRMESKPVFSWSTDPCRFACGAGNLLPSHESEPLESTTRECHRSALPVLFLTLRNRRTSSITPVQALELPRPYSATLR
jgi:uncharacterized protein DUF2490